MIFGWKTIKTNFKWITCFNQKPPTTAPIVKQQHHRQRVLICGIGSNQNYCTMSIWSPAGMVFVSSQWEWVLENHQLTNGLRLIRQSDFGQEVMEVGRGSRSMTPSSWTEPLTQMDIQLVAFVAGSSEMAKSNLLYIRSIGLHLWPGAAQHYNDRATLTRWPDEWPMAI